MPNRRIIFSTLILIIVLVVLYRESQSEGFHRLDGSILNSTFPRQTATNRDAFAVENGTRDHPGLAAEERVIASAGDQVVLKVYADRTFQLHLPDDSKRIFVPVGKELFTSDHLPSGSYLPAGVKIKIRNSAGEIFTAERGFGMRLSYGPDDVSWYRPGPNRIEMPVFSSRRSETGELIDIPGSSDVFEAVSNEPGARVSPRGNIEDLVFGLSPRIRLQSGLEFKLAILPYAITNARDSKGDYLTPEDFPRHETDWLDSDLLFDDE